MAVTGEDIEILGEHFTSGGVAPEGWRHRVGYDERRAYDEHINDIMIQNDVLNTAKLEGRAEGLAEGRLSTARNLKKLGIAPDTIARATGLSLEEIEKL